MKKIILLSHFVCRSAGLSEQAGSFRIRFYFVGQVSLFIIMSLSNNSFSQNVGIGTTTPHPRAVLELVSTNKGILIPKLTTTQRNNIPNPPAGLIIYNTTTDNFNVFDSVSWKSMQKELPVGVRVLADSEQNAELTELGFSFDGISYMGYRPPPTQVTIQDSVWYSINRNDPDSLKNPLAYYVGRIFWTGTEVLYLKPDSNFKYNPVTDKWSLHKNIFVGDTITGLLPEGVWTGTEAIFWNGQGNNDSKVYRFNPATNTFTVVPVFFPSLGRSGYSLIYTGSKIIMWGGEHLLNNYEYYNDGGIFDPQTNSWLGIAMPFSMVISMPARRDHSAVWTGTEMIVWGGEISHQCTTSTFPPTIVTRPTITNTGFRFNPATLQFSAITNAGGSRFNHSAVWTGTEMIVYGGQVFTGGGNCTSTTTNLSTGIRYTLSTNSWSSIPSSVASFDHYAFWNGNKMVVVGGNPLTRTIRCYSPSTNSWTLEIPLCPDNVYLDKSVWTGDKIISLTRPAVLFPNHDFLQGHAFSISPVTILQASPRSELILSVWRKN